MKLARYEEGSKSLSQIDDPVKKIGTQLIILGRILGMPTPKTQKEATEDNAIIDIIAMEIFEAYPGIRIEDVMHAFKLASRGQLPGIELKYDQNKKWNIITVHKVLRAYIRAAQKEMRRIEQEKIKKQQEEHRKNNPAIPCPPEIAKKINALYEKYHGQKQEAAHIFKPEPGKIKKIEELKKKINQ